MFGVLVLAFTVAFTSYIIGRRRAVEVGDPLYAMAALLRRGVLALPCGEGSYSTATDLINMLKVHKGIKVQMVTLVLQGLKVLP